jgi:phosphoglycolate phosphatase
LREAVNLSRIRLIVFDLDGTLVDSLADLAAAVNDALHQVEPRSPPLPVETVRTFIGDGARLLLARSLQAQGALESVDQILPLFLDSYRRGLMRSTTLYPGALPCLDALAGRHLAVLSNKPGDLSRELLTALGVSDRFVRIWGTGDVPERKPDPRGLLQLMAKLAVSAAETLVVGDSATDVRTARAASVSVVAVSYGFAPESLADEPPDLLLNDLRDLPAYLAADSHDAVML